MVSRENLINREISNSERNVVLKFNIEKIR